VSQSLCVKESPRGMRDFNTEAQGLRDTEGGGGVASTIINKNSES
jgi:hypothetical protein